ncbi:MAG TPA: hypothetical protein VKA14_09125 [Gammaproteobacteria bacterium]|nr:hypothetical protein [Gammaproteobacteria bacterium]
MATLPEKTQQILQSHAGLIHRVVLGCKNREMVPDLEDVLGMAEKNGWTDLVATVRKILAGDRDQALLRPLDEEDRIIVESILQGLQDPSTLPDLDAQADATMAAPGIASLVHAARTGNTEALQLIANMASQMLQAGGDMARLAAAVRPLVMGERDPNKLCEGMTTPEGEKLMQDVLAELAKLEAH